MNAAFGKALNGFDELIDKRIELLG